MTANKEKKKRKSKCISQRDKKKDGAINTPPKIVRQESKNKQRYKNSSKNERKKMIGE